MKKVFPLQVAGKNPERLLEAIKHEVRKYQQRERGKHLPSGADYWDFDCRFGADAASAQSIHSSAIRSCIDDAARQQWPSFYLEILARASQRQPRSAPDATAEQAADSAPAPARSAPEQAE
jgi:hypothetical protein